MRVENSVDLYLTLKNLEILQVCILSIDIELYPGHWYVEIDTVKDLAESRATSTRGVSAYHGGRGHPGILIAGSIQDLPSTTLLDLCDIQLKEVVEPCHKLLSVRRPLFLVPYVCWPLLATDLDSPILKQRMKFYIKPTLVCYPQELWCADGQNAHGGEVEFGEAQDWQRGGRVVSPETGVM